MDPHQVHKSQVALLALPYYILGSSQYSEALVVLVLPVHSQRSSLLALYLDSLVQVHSSFSVCPSPVGSLGLRYHVKTQEAVSSVFSQLGLEPNHTGLTAQSLFFLEELCRVKRSDTQTFSNYSNKVHLVCQAHKNLQTPRKTYKLLPSIKFTSSS